MTDRDKTGGEMLEELLDIGTGVGIILLPLWLVFVPGLLLFIVLPIVVLLAPVALLGALLAPPFLLVRWIRGRRRQAIAGASGRRSRAASISASLNSGSSRRPARNAS
jgi:hypothetical protein